MKKSQPVKPTARRWSSWAPSNDKIVVLDADLAGATMTKFFKAAYPDRFFDCGIAECNMMDVAAGLSTMGLIPFCSTFAMFGAGRAYRADPQLHRLPPFQCEDLLLPRRRVCGRGWR